MSSVVQVLTRSLHAAAAAPTEDGEHVYLIEESDGNLVQEKWVNDESEGKNYVTDGVKPNSPALYLEYQSEARHQPTCRATLSNVQCFSDTYSSSAILAISRVSSSI